MGFKKLVTVFRCSMLTDSMSKIFAFSAISSSWVFIFDCFLVSNELEAVLGCLTVADFKWQFFGFFTALNALRISLPFSYKSNS